ncbi:nucleotidyltransferase domain-containing protein [Flexivirga caeni]|uniref:DUF4111 domain-containing protein n=1 Tax=Flexivirga caeni TaxID=2294115 RepID=A0A3M9M4G2_9MICO|nr:nucleotidyltransferase domain-containing protein [Flexivirga caeni]RNI20454.1 DUF4111 domain-containing protein [Flexivirga caeni]
MEGVARPFWSEQAVRVADACVANVHDLVGVYLHGSAALGGFTRSSDLDILVVADGSVTGVAPVLLACATPSALELSIVSRAAAATPLAPYPFRLHIAGPARMSEDTGEGDPDLAAHYAVCRQSAIALFGPPPQDIFGAVSPHALVGYFVGELRWGLQYADQRYAVLNACRAVAFASGGRLLSKIDGADWWVSRFGPNPLVSQAKSAQLAGQPLGPADSAAAEFVARAIGLLEASARQIARYGARSV